MTQEERDIEFLQEIGAYMTGHFVGTQNRHMDTYIETDMLLPYVDEVSRFGHQISEQVPTDVELIIGISNGILTQWVAHHHGRRTGNRILAIHAQKDMYGGQRFRDHWVDHLKRKKAFVVEDVIHMGKTTGMVCRIARGLGADVLGVGALWNRGGVTAKDLEVPMLYAAINLALPSWTVEECAQVGPCSRDEDVDLYWGHGREFVAQRAK